MTAVHAARLAAATAAREATVARPVRVPMVEGRSAPDASGGSDEDLAGLRRFEVAATITGGIRLFCISCGDWFAEWSSLQKYPRVAELANVSEQHDCEEFARSLAAMFDEHARRASGPEA